MQIGIVGLPNAGKSTLFNALTRSRGAQAENYPFCTIDPNVGIVEVRDARLYRLAEINQSAKVVPAAVEFVDIAGLVKGASAGEGLGNQFLAHIRSCDAIAQVVRYFQDGNIIHVHGKVDPAEDVEVIHTELILADLQTLEKRLGEAEKKARSGDKEWQRKVAVLHRVKSELESGKRAINLNLNEDEREAIRDLHLLTNKPFVYIANVAENEVADFDMPEAQKALKVGEHEAVIPISAKMEAELIDFSPAEAADFLQEMGLRESGLNALIHAAYRLLGLHTYFTSGPKEARAWTIPIGAKAPQAAGKIHTDFEKGFIRAEVIAYTDYIETGSEAAARNIGKMRQEGKEYVVKDGDVILFRFNN